ncbi:DUF262 domain-containing protein [Pseudoduganella sp. UC29_106]|uniref:DUF262 domain-containing protein n=1 Tax=Pseudoduganella sp. UC29_106 TaxID=3374553 RepID=UPI003757367F
MQNIEGKIEPIGKLFSSDFFFTVPDYQRPFAWEESNFQDLVDDLEEARNGQQYFLGTLVLHKRGGKNNYDIVDGQQRITSLLILLACLRDMINDPKFKKSLQDKIVQEENKVDGIPELPRVTSKDRAIFRELVLGQDGTLTKKNRKISLSRKQGMFKRFRFLEKHFPSTVKLIWKNLSNSLTSIAI